MWWECDKGHMIRGEVLRSAHYFTDELQAQQQVQVGLRPDGTLQMSEGQNMNMAEWRGYREKCSTGHIMTPGETWETPVTQTSHTRFKLTRSGQQRDPRKITHETFWLPLGTLFFLKLISHQKFDISTVTKSSRQQTRREKAKNNPSPKSLEAVFTVRIPTRTRTRTRLSV